MQKSLFIVVLAVLVTLPLCATAAEWIERPSTDIGAIMDIDRALDDSLYVVGEAGTVAVSINDGLEWRQLPSVKMDSSLMSIDMVTKNYGFAVSSGGELFFTGDGWTTTPYRHQITDRQLRRVIAVGEQGEAFAFGQQGTLLHTTNIYTWNTIPINTTAYLHDGVWQGNEAWIVGSGKTLVHSTDGGATWAVSGGGVADDYRAVSFADDTHGYIGGTNGILLATIDGGSTWTQAAAVGLPANFTIEDLAFVTPNHGAAIIDDTLYETKDGGVTWTSHVVNDDVFAQVNNDANLIALVADPLNELFVAIGQTTEGSSIIRSIASFPQGQLVKRTCEGANDTTCNAIYYMSVDGKRHPFPSERVFFSWYESYHDVIEVSGAYLALFPLGDHVTYRPCSRMIKFVDSPSVYALTNGGILRHINNESTAEAIYGKDWNHQIDEISQTFAWHFTLGEPIMDADDVELVHELTSITIENSFE
jgi:photosystem II stability/assembly factor-like uncharacterized protein